MKKWKSTVFSKIMSIDIARKESENNKTMKQNNIAVNGEIIITFRGNQNDKESKT